MSEAKQPNHTPTPVMFRAPRAEVEAFKRKCKADGRNRSTVMRDLMNGFTAGRFSPYPKEGFTLVEVLVVVALVAILAGIAVPTYNAFFSSDDLKPAALELYANLRAAREYAISHHVPTGIAYIDPTADPTQIDKTAAFFRAYVVVSLDKSIQREVWVEYIDPITKEPGSYSFKEYYYTPTPGFPQVPESFRGDVAMIRTDPSGASIPLESIGFTKVRLHFPAETVTWNENQQVPAHIFNPNGQLSTLATLELFRARLAYSPEADEADRYHDDGSFRTIPLELHKTTGRVQIAEDPAS
jgi:prepilin-type N-terminal cleavage/methylation domain-containing protein